MGGIRRSRTTRGRARDYAITARDLRLLHAIGRMKFTTTSQLAALFFGHSSACSRRLAKLVALRLINVFVPQLNGENVYSLARAGFDLLVESGEPEEELHVAQRLRRAELRHLVAINDVRIGLALAVRRTYRAELELFLADHDLRRIAGQSRPAYIPDALIRIRTASGVLGYAMEVDAGTESHRYVVTRKIRVVDQLRRSGAACWGLTPWRPVLVTLTERRLRLLARTFVKHGAGTLWLGGLVEVIRSGRALSGILRTMEEISKTESGEMAHAQPRLS